MSILTAGGTLDSFAQFITVFIIFIFVLVMTYGVTRWISKYQKTQYVGTNIEVVETSRLTANKYLQIVRTGNKYIVIAVCKDTVTMLTELSEEELKLQEVSSGETLDFKTVLASFKGKKTEADSKDDGNE